MRSNGSEKTLPPNSFAKAMIAVSPLSNVAVTFDRKLDEQYFVRKKNKPIRQQRKRMVYFNQPRIATLWQCIAEAI